MVAGGTCRPEEHDDALAYAERRLSEHAERVAQQEGGLLRAAERGGLRVRPALAKNRPRVEEGVGWRGGKGGRSMKRLVEPCNEHRPPSAALRGRTGTAQADTTAPGLLRAAQRSADNRPSPPASCCGATPRAPEERLCLPKASDEPECRRAAQLQLRVFEIAPHSIPGRRSAWKGHIDTFTATLCGSSVAADSVSASLGEAKSEHLERRHDQLQSLGILFLLQDAPVNDAEKGARHEDAGCGD